MTLPGAGRATGSGRRARRRAWQAAVAASMVMVWLLTVGAAVASAHAFLVGSNPPQGARLSRPPSTLTLTFSERVVTSDTTVTVRLAGSGRRIPVTVERSSGGDASTVTVRLAATPKGIYVVSWQNVSAEDGHPALGEFAFAAGAVSGALPTAAQGGTAPNPLRVVATVLFLFGLSVALGGAVTGLVVDRTVTARSTAIRLGALAATVGAVIAFFGDAPTHGGGLTEAAVVAGAAAVLAALSLAAAGAARRLVPVLVGLVAAGVVWAADGHPALVGGAVGLAVNAVHLVVGAAWVGSLAWIVAGVVRYRKDHQQLVAVARRYSRLALPLVIVLAAAGGVSALEALPSWSSIYDSGYGQLVLVKTGLFALALALAAWSRRRGVGRARTSTLARAVPVEAGVVAVILVVTAVLASTGPPVKARPVVALLGPAPLTGPTTRTAGMAGQLTIAISAGSGQLQVQTYSSNQQTVAARIDMVAYEPNGRDVGLFPRPCGTGCFTQALTLPAGVTGLHVTATAHGWTGGTWTASLAWPPPATNPQLLSRLVAAMEAVPAVAVKDTVTSNTAGPSFTNVLRPISGRQLMALEPYSGDADQPGLITDVQPLTGPAPGMQVYLPGTPAWATLWVDSRGRLARDRIVDPGHVITDTFTYPAKPAPPASAPAAAPIAPATP